MEDLKGMQCPSCKGTFKMKPGRLMYYCPYCGMQVKVEENTEPVEVEEETEEIKCPSCEETMAVKPGRLFYYCPYCGMKIKTQKKEKKVQKEEVREETEETESGFEKLVEKQEAKIYVKEKDRFTQKYDILAMFVFFLAMAIGIIIDNQTGSKTAAMIIIVIGIVLAIAVYIKGEVDYRNYVKRVKTGEH